MSQDQPVMRVPVQQQVGQLVFTQPGGAPPIRFSPFGAQQQYQLLFLYLLPIGE